LETALRRDTTAGSSLKASAPPEWTGGGFPAAVARAALWHAPRRGLLLEQMNNCEQVALDMNRLKDPAFLEQWNSSGTKKLEDAWVVPVPLDAGVPRSAHIQADCDPQIRASIQTWEAEQQWAGEGLGARCKRLDGQKAARSGQGKARKRTYAVPGLIARQEDGGWLVSPSAARARPEKLAKAKALYELGLVKKAQRELACGLLGSEIICQNGHRFTVGYECGDRFCVDCGPKSAARLFAKHVDRLRTVAKRLVPCWPPHEGGRPDFVIAKIDFTLRNTGEMPDRARNQALNKSIKKFCRTLEREYGIDRSEYGLAYSDEIGGNNTNAHAHAVYVGLWLPNKKKQLSRLWSRVTPDGSFIISIKHARSIEAALAHATKYPSKFLRHSTPERLAALEKSYDRVRRFHLLGAFDKRLLEPEERENEKRTQGEFAQGRTCPHCGAKLSEPNGWRPLADLKLRGINDIFEVRREIGKQRIFASQGGKAP
jgi:hypothetical protein